MSAAANPSHEHSVKETIISLLISFVMALVFRSYVVEAFVIPTGSMAPTLLGKHTNHHSDVTGYDWAQNPTYYFDPRDRNFPMPIQGGMNNAPLISATDPMTTTRYNTPDISRPRPLGITTPPSSKPLLAGDRILVQKYLYNIFPPERYDVVVFKNPSKVENANENYIKRLIGLPNEQLLLVEGDVFARPLDASGSPTGDGAYTIQRKPRRIMEALWRTLFSSEYTPRAASNGFRMPWIGDGWSVEAGGRLVNGERSSTLAWNEELWPVWDWVPYNEPYHGANSGYVNFPVGDVRVRAGIEPLSEGTDVTIGVRVREHEFQAQLVGTGATIRMRPLGGGGSDGSWATLASGEIEALPAGGITNVEFWHYDQTLEVHVEGELVARGTYEWNASERYLHTVGATREAYEEERDLLPNLRQGESYRERSRPEIEWSFGGPVTLHRVGLDRDVYYRPEFRSAVTPDSAIKLGPDHFFCCGDNSAASFDGRGWTDVNSRVAELIDDTVGVVHRDLMLGKAFFVYFPSIYKVFGKVPIPNAGDMRLIR